MQIKPASVSLAPTRRKHVTSMRAGKSMARPWQVGSPSGVCHLGRAGSPSTQMWPPLSSSLGKFHPTAALYSLLFFLGLAQALCPGLDWRPHWRSLLKSDQLVPGDSPQSWANPDGWSPYTVLPLISFFFFFSLCKFELVTRFLPSVKQKDYFRKSLQSLCNSKML